MKVAIITDQHFGMRKGSQIFHDYMKKFYDEVFFPFLDKNKITTVLDLGDTFDNRKSIDFWSLDWAKTNYYDPLASRGIQVYTVVGNHTAYYKNTLGINAIKLLLQEYENVHLIERPETINVGGLDVCFIPWICVDNETETYEEIAKTSATIAMGHLELSGFEAHVGYYMDHGMSREVFSKFKKVFSGHFHHRSHSDNIYYLGNPYQMYWNDFGDVRGFHAFDTQTTNLKFIPNPFKMFEKIYYDDTIGLHFDDQYDFKQHKDKYVKLVVVNKKDLYQFDMFVDKLLQADCHEVKIVEDFSDLDATNVSDDIVENTQDTMTLLELYIDDLPVDLSKDRLKNTTRQLYIEAQDLEI